MTARGVKRDVAQAGKQPPHIAGDSRVWVEHERDGRIAAPSDSAEACRDRFEAIAPAFSPMAGDEEPALSGVRLWGRDKRQAPKQRIDAGIARYLDLTAVTLATKIRRAQFRRCEEQCRQPVDGDAEVLFRPRVAAIMAAQAGLDMGYRDARLGGT